MTCQKTSWNRPNFELFKKAQRRSTQSDRYGHPFKSYCRYKVIDNENLHFDSQSLTTTIDSFNLVGVPRCQTDDVILTSLHSWVGNVSKDSFNLITFDRRHRIDAEQLDLMTVPIAQWYSVGWSCRPLPGMLVQIRIVAIDRLIVIQRLWLSVIIITAKRLVLDYRKVIPGIVTYTWRYWSVLASGHLTWTIT